MRFARRIRRLRDRWMEQVNADGSLLLPNATYDVSKERPAPPTHIIEAVPSMAVPAPDSTGSTGSRQAGSPQAVAA
jgi:hypothetical protein